MGINHIINEIAEKYFDNNNSKFAKAMHTSEANIRNYRLKTAPRVDFMLKLKKHLGLSYEYLFEGKSQDFSSSAVADPDVPYGKDAEIARLKEKVMELQDNVINLQGQLLIKSPKTAADYTGSSARPLPGELAQKTSKY